MAAATDDSNLKIGFLGLGIMGVAMVRHCLPLPTPKAPMHESQAWHNFQTARLTRKVVNTPLSKPYYNYRSCGGAMT